MKLILYSILIIMFLITGCLKENSVEDQIVEAVQQNEEPNNGENSSNNSKTIVDQVMNNALKDSIKNSEGNEIILRDKLFIAQCNDIYLNPDEYMDKTIIWEGIYTEVTNPLTNETYKFVIRLGPGCCGNDGTAGFEILYDGEFPKQDDWVEAVGKIEMIEEDGNEFVAIRLTKLSVLDVRGQEFVSN